MEKSGMGPEDEIIGALCAWRENRGGGRLGMQSVLNVLMNRAAQRKTSVYTEAVRPMQFSSMTAKGDPNLSEYPLATDPQWAMALILAGQMTNGTLPDITQGSNLYFNPAGIGPTDKTFALPDGSIIPFPQGWNPLVVTFKLQIAGHYFFVE
jgi:hypothetical protein